MMRAWLFRLKPLAHAPILNKVGQFVSSPIIRQIIETPKSSIDMEDGGAAKNNHVAMAKRPSYLNHQSTGGAGTARTMQ
jgi:hypothetical protein